MPVSFPPLALARNNKLRFANSRLVVPNFANCQQVMSNPFAAELVANANVISNPLYWPSCSTDPGNLINNTTGQIASSYFSLSGAGGWQATGSGFPNPIFITATSVNYGAGSLAFNAAKISFHHYGSEIEIAMKGSSSSFVVKVDDQYLSLLPVSLPNDGSVYHYYINFGSVGFRRIEIIGGGNFNFAGVYTDQTDMICPAPLRGPRCIVMGDSFTEGTGADVPLSYVQYMADFLGWDDVWSSGVGSTGYLATSGSRGTFRSRVSTDVIAFNPDVVLVCGGYNDVAFTQSQINTEAQLLYNEILANLPGVTLIASANFRNQGPGSMSNAVVGVRAGIKQAAAAVGAIFIDPNEQPLPPNYVADSQALQSNVSAGGGSITFPNMPVIGGTYKFPDGTKFQILSASLSSDWTATIDAPLQNNQSSGTIMTQCGSPYLTGTGYAGAPTGVGTADRFVYSDDTHPSPEGHKALGYTQAAQLIAALAPN